jgi:hypothetical protein
MFVAGPRKRGRAYDGGRTRANKSEAAKANTEKAKTEAGNAAVRSMNSHERRKDASEHLRTRRAARFAKDRLAQTESFNGVTMPNSQT